MEVGGWQQMKVQGVRGLCKCKKYIYIYIEKEGLKELVFGRFGQVFFVSLMFQTLIWTQKIMESKADRYLLP